LFGTQL